MKIIIALTLAGLLAGCAQISQLSSDINKIDPVIEAVCMDALAITAVAVPETTGTSVGSTVGSIADYIKAACGTADAIAKLGADPTSTAWLSDLVTELKALVPSLGS